MPLPVEMPLPEPTALKPLLAGDVKEPTWLVRSALPRGTLITLAGDPGVGKSVLSYTLAYAVAAGVPFLGFDTVPTTVCYFDEENSGIDRMRYNQWVWRGLGEPDITRLESCLFLYHFALTSDWRQILVALCRKHRPGLIVLDTATPALHIQDENDNSEASRAIQFLRHAQSEAANDTTVLILKHERQRDDRSHRRTIRGAKVWLGAVDRTFYHSRLRGRPRKDGLSETALVPDKLRSTGLEVALRIIPRWTDPLRKGLILQGELDESVSLEHGDEKAQ